MIVKTPYVRPITFEEEPAYRKAQAHYLTVELTNPAGEKVTFEDDILYAFLNGWIHSSPTSFAMGWVINIAPEKLRIITPAWFIRYAVGNFIEIVKLLPFPLEYILFCRDNEDGGTTFHKWKTARLLKLAQRPRGAGGVHKSRQAGSIPAAARKKVA